MLPHAWIPVSVCVCVGGKLLQGLRWTWAAAEVESRQSASIPPQLILPLYVVFFFAQRWDGSLCRCLAAGEAAIQYLISRPRGCVCTPYTRICLPTSLDTRARWGFSPDNYGVNNLWLSFPSEELRLRCVAGQINEEIPEAFAVKSQYCKILKMF